MKYTDFFKEFQGKYWQHNFTNKHGEKFIVIRTKGITNMWLITGDEFDWEVERLFNPAFDVYTHEEIQGVAKALATLHDTMPTKEEKKDIKPKLAEKEDC